MTDIADHLRRIADALERLAPPAPPEPDFAAAAVFQYEAERGAFNPVATHALPLDLLAGIDAQKALVHRTVGEFVVRPVNHILLWGARGTGKSSLIKSVAADLSARHPALKLVELDRDHLAGLPTLFAYLRPLPYRFIVFCDDLSFEAGSSAAKSLKSALEGGVMGAPENVLFAATSNRRHLAPERHDQAEGLLAAAEQAEETVSVSDRFGLWIGFPPMDQATYLDAVQRYGDYFGLDTSDLKPRALQWAARRGGRSGRVAWQFIRQWAGEQAIDLPA